MKNDIAALTRAVEKMHGAPAQFVASVPVHEQFDGVTAWNGLVSQFQLTGHPTAHYCYAWSVPATKGAPERYYAVLHTPQIDSPIKAVRATFVAEHRKRIKGTSPETKKVDPDAGDKESNDRLAKSIKERLSESARRAAQAKWRKSESSKGS